MFGIAHSEVIFALGETDVTFDSTALTQGARHDLLKLADLAPDGCLKSLTVFTTPFEVCMERNSNRDRVVPDDIMYKMHARYHTSLSQIGHEGWDVIHFVGG